MRFVLFFFFLCPLYTQGSHWPEVLVLLFLILPLSSGGHRRLLLSHVLLILLSFDPALRGDHLFGPVWRGTEQSLYVIVVHYLTLKKRISQLKQKCIVLVCPLAFNSLSEILDYCIVYKHH